MIERDAVAQQKSSDVLVIGAGVAGLAAAREISAAGFSVSVLEARDRIGGRILTIHDQNSAVPIELGAEFVHGRPEETLEIVQSARLILCDAAERHWQLREGVLIRSDEFWSELEQIMDGMRNIGERDLSFNDYLNRFCPNYSDEAKAVATMFVQGFHAARAEVISVKSLVQENDAAGRIDGDRQFRILSGYDRLARSLQHEAVSAGARFHLNTVVEQVRWERNHVEATVRTGHGNQFHEATRAILTLPLGVMQAALPAAGAVQFIPDLPDKQKAARALMMGHAVKINLRFREPFWEQLELKTKDGREALTDLGFIHSADELIPTWWTQLPVRVPMLVGWAGGPAAEELAAGDEQRIIDVAVNSLAHILGVSRSRLDSLIEASYMHDWNRDPFTRGAYSYVAVGSLNAQAELARPVEDTLFFAGEATNTEGHCGTVHGAIATGVRAGREAASSLSRVDLHQRGSSR